jgi:hypothetical protein
VIVFKANLPMVWDVAYRMREKDYDEISAISFAKDRKELADGLSVACCKTPAMYVCSEERPIVVIGWSMPRPNIAQIGMFATDEYTKIASGINRFVVREMFQDINRYNIHRLECFSLGSHAQAHSWLEWLGLKKEADLEGYGRNGEKFVSFAWTRKPGATDIRWRSKGNLC